MIPPAKKKVELSDSKLIDMLSDLPDCIIIHILSFLTTKEAVQTCILSARWKDLWKHLSDLLFYRSDCSSIKKFTKFLSKFLSLRDSSTALHSLDFNHNGCLKHYIIKRVVNYAISHNVQRLGLNVTSEIALIPISLFSSKTLTHLELCIKNDKVAQISLNLPALTYLNLSVYTRRHFPVNTVFPKSFNLPSLTSLYLKNFAFLAGGNGRAEPFSAFDRLNSLFLCSFVLRGTLTLFISSATLVNFTMRNSYSYKVELCTPNLGTFSFIGKPCQKIIGNGLSHVKHVDIDAQVFSFDMETSLLLLSWLLDLHNITSLTVTTSTLQLLSLNSNLLKIKLPFFGNLKSLKVKKEPLASGCISKVIKAQLEKIKSQKEVARLLKPIKTGLEPSAPIPDGIVDYLIQNSPSAEVEIIEWSL